MRYKLLAIALISLLLSSCTFNSISTDVRYDNTFIPWPSGTSYSSVVDCNKSFFKCEYDYNYEYYLVFESGEIIEYKGYYRYVDESFVLGDDNTKIIIKKYSYYQFTQEIEYEDKSYIIIWHAKHIFD